LRLHGFLNANRSERGLEISAIAVVDVDNHRAYTLSVQQTPAPIAEQQRPTGPQRVRRQTVEEIQQMLQQLPDQTTASAPTRIDHYLGQLRQTRPYLSAAVRYWTVDGFYAKKKFVDGVVELDLAVISKLRSDADLRYLYTGVQKPRGAKRKYDGKVVLGDWTHLFAS
jgi:hypothetical protein